MSPHWPENSPAAANCFSAAVSKNVFSSKTERFWPILGLPPGGLSRFSAAGNRTGFGLGGPKMKKKNSTFLFFVPVPTSLISSKTEQFGPILGLLPRDLAVFTRSQLGLPLFLIR